MRVTVKKCHMIMSGKDCWNSVCFSCCRKADNDFADVALSGRLFENCAAATGNARPPMVDSLNGGIRRRFDPAERSAGRPDTSPTCSLHVHFFDILTTNFSAPGTFRSLLLYNAALERELTIRGADARTDCTNA